MTRISKIRPLAALALGALGLGACTTEDMAMWADGMSMAAAELDAQYNACPPGMFRASQTSVYGTPVYPAPIYSPGLYTPDPYASAYGTGTSACVYPLTATYTYGEDRHHDRHDRRGDDDYRDGYKDGYRDGRIRRD